MRSFSALLLALLAGSFLNLALASDVAVFSPKGAARDVRQVAVRFASPMVAFGDPQAPEPFAIACPVPGKGRWLDDRNWVWDADAELPAGIRCAFTLKDGLKALDGQPVSASEPFRFHTGGPAILTSEPGEGASVDERQVFILGLSAPAREESIRQHAACVVKGLPERIPVEVLTGKAREEILAQRKQFMEQYYRVLDVRGHLLGMLAVREQGSKREKFLRMTDGPDTPLAVVRCRRTLPADTQVSLTWGAGIAVAGGTGEGLATAKAQNLIFRVRPEFSAAFSCERLKKDGPCLPILPWNLRFSAPVAVEAAKRVRLVAIGGQSWPATLNKDEEKAGFVESLSFPRILPEKAIFRIQLPAGLKDDAGRPLVNGDRYPLAVRSGEYPPLAKFPSRFGIIEKDAGPALLPVTLRNLEKRIQGATVEVGGAAASTRDALQALAWLKRLNDLDRDDTPPPEPAGDEPAGKAAADRPASGPGSKSVFQPGEAKRAFTLPKPGGAEAFEVVGIPLSGAGFHVVELASPRLGEALLGRKQPYRVAAAALVTNLAVHFKQGRESSLAWVTRLDKGEPVAGAEVRVMDCAGKVYAKGRTDASGRFNVNRALPRRDTLPSCVMEGDGQYFVTAALEGDFSFVLSNWNEGINAWRFGLPQGSADDAVRAHAVLDRSLFRAGETVHLKLFLRRATRTGFGPAGFPQPAKAILRHVGSDDRFELPLVWQKDAQGLALATWVIPKEAKQGAYDIALDIPGQYGPRDILAGSFRVESFRLPVMRGRIEVSGAPLVKADKAELAVQVDYLSGGPARDLPVRLRGQVRPKEVSFPDWEGFTLANGDVKTGSGPRRSWQDEIEGEGGEGDSASAAVLGPKDFRLDAIGSGKAQLPGLPPSDRPRELLAELEYRDPNGETATAAALVPLWPARVIVGLKSERWLSGPGPIRLQAVVLDLAGKPVAGAQVAVDALQREYRSYRRRLVGGFYAYEHEEEVKPLGALCQGKTDERGLLVCEAAAPAPGNLILRARATDADGNPSVAHQDFWMEGGDGWQAASDNDRMDLIPEKKAWEPGDKARFQVRMPFAKATVLVTVEREGVMESFVTRLNRAKPVIEVPIKGAHAPNVFVSALAVRGRLAKPAATALVDLAKPAFRLGMAEIRVGHGSHELKVKLAADQPVYKVRDKGRVNIEVRLPDGSAPPKGSEVALAAVDEALLELKPNTSWKLLEAMMSQRGIEVETATGQIQVMGKRHFGRKALPSGGGGGRRASRELFDTLLSWQPRVKLDDEGRASVEVALNDSLTSFRIVAVAHGGLERYGTGSTSFRSSQDLMLVSGLPPLVREGDRYRAGFTVRNASDAPQEVELTAHLAPQSAGKTGAGRELAPITLSLAAGESRETGWDVEAPLDADGLQWQVAARIKGKGEGDRLKLGQRVIPALSVQPWQATLMQLDGKQELAVSRPDGALPGRGGVRVAFRAKLAEQLTGVRDYMGRYPYSCLEQQASKAVALDDKAGWDALMARLPAWLDQDGLARYFPPMREGSDVLTAYLLSLSQAAGWPIPESSRQRLTGALTAFVQGKLDRRSPLPVADRGLRKLGALAALAGETKVPAAWLDSLSIAPELWPTSALLDWIVLLERQPQLPQRDQRLAEAENLLRARLYFTGSRVNFSTERNDALWWLMSDGDVNTNRALFALMQRPGWQAELPKMAAGSLGRQQKGHWSTTVANAWGRLAMESFSRRFEQAPVAGQSEARLDGASFAQDWAGGKGGSRVLAWPSTGSGRLDLAHQGGGKPWVTVQSLAALPLKEARFSGLRLERRISPVSQKQPGRWQVGDVARVHLDMEALSDTGWVVLNDPIPAGARVLGSGLGGDSAMLSAGKARSDWWAEPDFQERAFDGYRAYWRFIPKGKWSVEYTVRLDNAGDFQLPPARLEAMYAPEMFGELPGGVFRVEK